MKAAFLTGIRQMEVKEAPRPEIQSPDEVLVRVEAVGVCGSDVHYYNEGRIGTQVVEYPWTIGHECAGTIAQAGAGVRGVKVGQRVAVDPLISCGACDQCLAGRENTCRSQRFMGSPRQARGAMAQYVVMPARNCHPIPPSMTMVEAAMCEPLAIGLYAARMAALPGGSSTAILGSGAIGLGVLLALRSQGAGRVRAYVTDLLEERLAMAGSLGADRTLMPTRQDVVAAIRNEQPGGVDCVFECAGKQETIDQGIDLLRPGGTLYVIGIPQEQRVSFNYDLARRGELRLQCVRRQNRCTADTIGLIAGGRIRPAALATHHFPLGEAGAAIDLLLNYRDGVVKAIIHPAE